MALTTIPSELSSVSGISDSSTSTAITINSSQEVTFAGNITTGSNTISGVLASAITATTQAASDNSTKLATTAYVTTALANLVDSAPGTLNTLNELAAALGDDANFSTTVTNSIATKLPLAGGTMTGALNMGSQNITNAGTLNGITTTQSVSGTRWGVLPEIAANGVMEIGRYVDFHATSGDTSDYGARFDFDGSKMILTSDFEGSGTIRGTRLGGNAAPNSNYAINTLQNGSMTHAGYFQANGDDIGIEINATAGTYSSSALYVRQSSVATGGNLARFANSAGDKFLVSTAGNVSIGTVNTARRLNIKSGSRNATTLAIEDASSTEEIVRIGQQGDGDGFFQLRNTAGAGTILLDASGINYISGGNVGIGTSNPEAKLHVSNSNSGGVGSVLVLDNPSTSAANNGNQIAFLNDVGASYAGVANARIQTLTTTASSGASALTFTTWNGTTEAEKVRIGDNGYVGFGTTALNKFFNLVDPAQGGEEIKLHFEASSGGDLWNIYSYDRVNSHYTNMLLGQYTYIKSGGEVSIGNANGDFRVNQKLGVVGAGTRGGISVSSYINSTTSAIFDFNKSRHATPGNHTIVQNGDALGVLIWRGDDGNEFVDAAAISANVDSTPGNDDMPGRLEFYTSPDGTQGLQERMRIDNQGRVTMPYQPAFQAYKSAQNNLSINHTHVIAFQNERFDIGSNFDGGGSNSFTAPVTGKYQFNVNVRLLQLDTAANYIQVRLVTSNRGYELFLIDPGRFSGDVDYFTFGGSILVDMDANDAAYVTVYQSSGSVQLDIGGGGDSHFSGYLVA